MKTLKVLPSLITMGNLLCGFLAIAYIADGRLVAAAWLIFAGMLFDVLDGKVARLTNGSSDFGVQLDSLADMITFGVAPAFLIKVHLLEAPSCAPARLVWTISLLFVLCAAARLARFNVTTEHTEDSHRYFQGLATPAAAGVLSSLVLLSDIAGGVMPVVYYRVALLGLTGILAALMVSNIRYVHMGVLCLNKGHLVADGVAFALFMVLVAIEPQILVVALSGVFCLYALAAPCTNLCRTLLAPVPKHLASTASESNGQLEGMSLN